MTEFAILPDKKIEESYIWLYTTFNMAKTKAEDLCQRYNTPVRIAKVVGIFRSTTFFEGNEDVTP